VVGAQAMEQAITDLASHLREGDRIGSEVGRHIELPQAVVITGMGGSAMGGELLRGLIASHCPVPITRVRGFGIPGWAGAGTLVVCVSYSGNTLETLSCAERARRQGAALLVVGSGGTLGDLAHRWDAPYAQVPGGLQPRAALGYLFGATAGAFGACGLARGGIAREAAEGAALADRDAARDLGERLATTVPLIYGAGPLGAVAYRWKTQLNENAKMHAFSHAFPELDHNEIVGWSGADPGTFSAVILREQTEQTETRAMIEITSELIEPDAAFVEHVPGVGTTVSARAFSLVAFGDWASYHAAAVRGVDPVPVERIGELKRRIDDAIA
jgi:glucose/mannose-6-phosphate isomerase